MMWQLSVGMQCCVLDYSLKLCCLGRLAMRDGRFGIHWDAVELCQVRLG